MAKESPSNDQIFKWFDELSNWGRWGKDDTHGHAEPHYSRETASSQRTG